MFGLVVDVEKRVSFVWGVKLSSERCHAFMFAVSSQMVVVRLSAKQKASSHVKLGCMVSLVTEEDDTFKMLMATKGLNRPVLKHGPRSLTYVRA